MRAGRAVQVGAGGRASPGGRDAGGVGWGQARWRGWVGGSVPIPITEVLLIQKVFITLLLFVDATPSRSKRMGLWSIFATFFGWIESKGFNKPSFLVMPALLNGSGARVARGRGRMGGLVQAGVGGWASPGRGGRVGWRASPSSRWAGGRSG